MTQRYEAQMKLFEPDEKLPVHNEVQLRPKAGYRYIYKWEEKTKRNDWRDDGYRWRQNSTIRFKFGDVECKRYYFKLQVGPAGEYSTEFTKHAIETPLYEKQTLVWYQGDDSVIVDYAFKKSKAVVNDPGCPSLELEKTQRYETQLKFFEPESNVPVLSEVQIRPKPGYRYIFKWSNPTERNDWRADGYRWRQNSRITFSYRDVECKRYYFKLQVGPCGECTTEFTKHAIECPLYENQMLVWYQGDDSVVVDFAHGNSKDPEKEFHRTAPSVLTKIKSEMQKLPGQVYSELVSAAPREVDRHIIDSPRDIKQVRNALKLARKATRISMGLESPRTPSERRHTTTPKNNNKQKAQGLVLKAKRLSLDAIVNLMELRSEIGFVSDVHLAPNLLVICYLENTLSEFKQLLNRPDLPSQCLSYDVALELADLRLSVLSYRQTEFDETPVIPLLFMIYEPHQTSAHQFLFSRLLDIAPEIKTCDKLIMVCDEDEAIIDVVQKSCPEIPRYRCWLHVLRKIKTKLVSLKIYDVKLAQEYENDFNRLVNQDSLSAYKTLLAQLYLKKWKKDFAEYFDSEIDPDIEKLGVWAFTPLEISFEAAGQSEVFRCIKQRCSELKTISVDKLVINLMAIAEFFNNRTSRSRYRLGEYTLREHLVECYSEALTENVVEIPETATIDDIIARVQLSNSQVDSACESEDTSNESPPKKKAKGSSSHKELDSKKLRVVGASVDDGNSAVVLEGEEEMLEIEIDAGTAQQLPQGWESCIVEVATTAQA